MTMNSFINHDLQTMKTLFEKNYWKNYNYFHNKYAKKKSGTAALNLTSGSSVAPDLKTS